MKAEAYLEALQITHRNERPAWTEPQWSAYWSALLAVSNVLAELSARLDTLEAERPAANLPGQALEGD